MSFSAIAIALGSSILGALGQQTLDKATGGVLSEVQGKLEERFRLGKFGTVQGALEGARDELVGQAETPQQREMVSRVLERLLGSQEGALLDELTAQVTGIYLVPTVEGASTEALARLYRRQEGPFAAILGQVPDEQVLNELLGAFFMAFRERLLREPDFAYLREYFVLTESREQTDLLKGVLVRLEAIAANTARPVQNLSGLGQDYRDYLIRLYQDHVIRGFSPRVRGHNVSLPLSKIFLPLEAIEGRPALAEYAEADLFRSARAMGELDWQRHSLEMEKQAAHLTVQLAAQRPLSLAELLESSRAVLLGDPGSGKTTVTRYISYALAADDGTHIGRRRLGLRPILIRLANFGKAFKRDPTLHLIEYVAEELTSRFGGYLRQGIEDGVCLIILDGLDEVTEPSLRLQVTERIQTMVASYHHNRFLVTSRIIGYDHSPLTREFKHATLKELNQRDKERFVRLWYEVLQAETSGSIAGERADDLIRVLQRKPQISRLGANPLLLTIMVLMHSRGVKLPNRRVELYQNATETLIEYWTRRREIDLDAYEIKAILAPIAHYILGSNVGGVIGHYDLQPRFWHGIIEQQGCNRAQARRLGDKLLKILSEQSGIFLERGLDAQGQPVYGFLHQTFGEYLAARHIADEVLSDTFQIEQYIHRTMWHEPLLLAAGHLALVSQTHLTHLIQQTLTFDAPYEAQLQRNLLLVAGFLADDIQTKPQLRRQILHDLALLLQHKAPQVRQAAVNLYHRLATTRYHRDSAIRTLKHTLQEIEDIDKLDAKIRFDLAQALVHLDQQALAKPLLWPLEEEQYQQEIRQDKVQRLRVEGWLDEAVAYLCEWHADKNKSFDIWPAERLGDFMVGPIDGASARDLLGEEQLLRLCDQLLSQSTKKIEQAELRLLAALTPEGGHFSDLGALMSAETPSEVRSLAAIRLLESPHRAEAITVLRELIATEAKEAPKSVQVLLAINEIADIDWQLLYDTALIGDDESAPQAIVALLQAGQLAMALPAALHLLAIYPPNTISRREARLWPVVEALIEQGEREIREIGLSAARWLALRPGYSYRLQACEALLEAGEIELALPLFKYLAYECHDESSQKACQRLLLLKEIDPIVPLLAHLSSSDSHEMCYHACLALALVEQPAATCHSVARPRHELKISILDERLQSYQDALQKFSQAGLNALNHLPTTEPQSQAYQEIARLALQMLADSGVSANQADTIGQLLNHQSPPVLVNAALFDLRGGRFERSHHVLVTLLSDTTQPLSLPVHLKALTTLGQLISPQTTTLLLEALQHQKSPIRSHAASLLGPLGDQTAVQPLINALNDTNPNVRRSAATALAELGNPIAVQALIEALNDEEESVRRNVVDALGQLGDIVALQPLLNALNDEYDRVRARAASALRNFEAPQVIQPLLAALEDESAQVRYQAVRALGHSNDRTVLNPLMTMLKDDASSLVRWVAAESLGIFGDPIAIQPLLDALNDQDAFVRRTAASALPWLDQDDVVIEALNNAINDQDHLMHTSAAITLGFLGNPIATQLLIKALNHEDENIRYGAAQAMIRVSNLNITKIWLTILYEENVGPRQFIGFGQELLDDSSVVQHLIGSLSDEVFVIRENITTALGQFSDPTIAKSLIMIQFEGDDSKRDLLARAICRLGAHQYIPLLIATSIVASRYTAYRYAKALIHLDPPKALPVLARYEQQFRRASSLKRLRGQLMWQLGDMEAALRCFGEALEQEENSRNLLALAHFYIEQEDLEQASSYIEEALQKVRWRGARAICLLSQAVVEWLRGEVEVSLETLGQAQQRDRHVTRIKDLQYEYFWREKAIGAVEAMLVEVGGQA